MTAEKKETGEQKLLRLIEEQGGDAGTSAKTETSSSESVAPEVAAVASSVKGLGIPNVGLPPALASLLNFFQGKDKKISFGLKEINKILLVVLIVAVTIFLVNLVSGLHQNMRITISSVATAKVSPPSAITIPSPEPLTAFMNDIQRRNIFQPYEKKVVETEEGIETVEEKKMDSIVKNWRLVGISSVEDEGTPVAMIEDTKSGITHFVSEGEKINNVLVKKIKEGEVILSYEGEETSLKL